MTFAFSKEDRTLHTFATEAEATAYAEGIDVQNGIWQFFDARGITLEAVFTIPNERGKLTVRSGAYYLRPMQAAQTATLHDILPQVTLFEGELSSLDLVQQFLSKSTHSTAR